MENSGFWVLNSVSDTQLQIELRKLLASGSRTEARIIAHLAEVDERRLHLRAGSESLYSYCIHTLGLSNTEAFHRITAARIARRFTIVFSLLEQRALHLTAVCLLRDYLTIENHEELLTAATHKTKVEVEELIALRFPRPDVASRIRKLPAPRTAAPLLKSPECSMSESQSCEPQSCEPQPCEPQPCEPQPCEPQPCESHLRESNLLTPAAPPSTASNVALPTVAAASASAHRTTTRPQAAPQPRSIEPLSEARYRIQLNASAALKEKLDRLRELTSHSNPTGDIAVLIERALDAAIEQAEKQRFAKTQRPRRDTPRQQARRSATPPAEARHSLVSINRELEPRKRQHIANAVVREVAERDQERCTFVGPDGCRCTARAFLQVHHEQSWARGGSDTADNLRLLCSSHNRLLAEQEFGARYVAQRVEQRRRQRGSGD